MKRSALVALALIAAMLPVGIRAQSSTNVQSFTAAGTDASPTFTGGYNTCSLQVSGTWTGFTVVPKGSSDNGLTFPTTITTIGGGSISSNGNYSGSISGLALTNFEYVVSGASPTGTIVITKTCNAQLSSVSVTGVPTAAPAPTFPAVYPLPTSYQTAFPTPAPPARNSTGYTTPVQCDNIAFNTGTSGVLITHSGTTTTYVCSITVGVVGSAGAAIYGKYGTGTVCGTGSVNLFETFVGTQAAFAWGGGLGAIFSVPSGNDTCFGTTGTITNDSITVTYAQF